MLQKQRDQKQRNHQKISETKNKLSGDDFLCKISQPTFVICKNPAEDPSVNKMDTMSEAILESGQSPDSQETISDTSLLPEIDEIETSKPLPPDELQTSTGFSGNRIF